MMTLHDTMHSFLEETEPPQGLYTDICLRLAQLRRRRARVRLARQSVLSFLFGLALVPLAQYAGQEFYLSGFYEYASLLFSDGRLLASSWHEIVFSLVEALPSPALLLLLGATVALLWSLRRAVATSRTAFSSLPRSI